MTILSAELSCSETDIAFKRQSIDTTWDVLHGTAEYTQQRSGRNEIDPIYAGRFLISKDGVCSIQVNAFSSGTSPQPKHIDINLTIGTVVVPNSSFTFNQVSEKIVSATYTSYYLAGTYVYFYYHYNLLEHSSQSNITISYDNGDYQLLIGTDCNKCYEGPGCASSTQNPVRCVKCTLTPILM